MALTNIALVSQSIMTLLEKVVEVRHGTTLITTAAPPEAAPLDNNVVSVYLFHVSESEYHKNASPPPFAAGRVPIANTPMALVLQYVITGVPSDIEDSDKVLDQQRVLGWIAKALHDFPIVDDSTSVGGDTILHVDLRNKHNVISLIIRPVSIQESLTFWSGEQKRFTRLSLFVEARVVLLEPEAPEQISGVVTSVGDFFFVGGAPQLLRSRSVVSFAVPVEGTNRLQQIALSPARVGLFVGGATPAFEFPQQSDNNLLTLEASAISGTRRLLKLRRDALRVTLDLDDAAHNADWAVQVGPRSVTLRTQREVFDADTASTRDLTPGVYSVRMVVVQENASGSRQSLGSNELAVALAPQIAQVTSNADDTYTLTVVGAFLNDTDLELELGVGSTSLKLTTGTLGEWEYEIATDSTLIFKRAAAIVPSPTEPLSLRLLVNGVLAPPVWLMEA